MSKKFSDSEKLDLILENLVEIRSEIRVQNYDINHLKSLISRLETDLKTQSVLKQREESDKRCGDE